MNIMIVNSKIKQKSKTMLGVIKNQVLDFILYFVTVYIIWETTLYMQHECREKHQIHYASLEEVKKIYGKRFTTVTTHKNVQNHYNEKWTYNVNTHYNLPYALKIWNCLNFIRKTRLIFSLIKLLFIKVRCLINVNVSIEATLEGQGW